MKPELIFINEKDGMVTMTKEDLEALVEKAYQAGRSDGGGITTTPWIVPTTPYYGKAVDATCTSEETITKKPYRNPWLVPTTPYYATGFDKMEGER